MTRQEVLDLANQLTEHKAESVISLPLLYQHVLQEFCGENRFWWRKQRFSFNTAGGTPTYDLSTQASTYGLKDVAIEEVVKVYLLQDSAPTLVEVLPVFDDLTLIEAAESTLQDQPGTYTFDLNDYKTVRLIDIPDKAYKIWVTAWMMPNPASDTTSDTVPLVPPWLHRAIVHGMEKYIWRVVYGQEDPKTLTAQAAYDKAIIQAQMRPRFTTQFTSQLISSEDAVRSTNGGSQF